jgi:hypothetical protein
MTAEEFLKSKDVIWKTDYGTDVVNDFDCCKMMVEFAKLKVTEALKAAQRRHGETQTYEPEHSHIVNYAILTAYPLDLIK